MKWRLIISLGLLFGLLLGAARLWYWPGWLYGPIALAAIAVSPVMLARARGKVLVNGLCTGLLIGLVQVGLVLALWDRHTASEQYEMHYDPSLKLQPVLAEMLRSELMSIAPLAAIWGSIIGLLSWGFSWILGKVKIDRQPTRQAPKDQTDLSGWRMNWRLILSLAGVFGLFLGLKFVMCWTLGTQYWMIIVIAVSAFIVAYAGGRVFANGFITGALIPLIQVSVLLLLWRELYHHNGVLLSQPSLFKLSWPATYALISIPIGVIWGLLVGSLAWLINRLGFHGKPKPQEPDSPGGQD